MKTMKNMLSMKLMSLLVMFVMVAFSSCTEDEDGVVEPTFPELKELSGNVGQILDITFSANVDWTMKSNVAWCKFVNGEFLESTASGKAGDQTLKVQILSDESWNSETEDVAELSLTMGETTQVIYKITRGKKVGQGLIITDADGKEYNAETPLTIKGSGLREASIDSVFTVVTASADMEVGITEMPAWLYVKNIGNGVFRFIFDKGKESTHGKSPIYSFSDPNDKIVFATADGSETVEIPVNYEGLKASYVELHDAVADGYPSELNVSADGQTFTSETTNMETGAVETGESFSGPLKTTVIARNDLFHVLAIDMQKKEAPNMAPYNVLNVNEEGVDWIETTTNKTNLTLTVKALEGETRGAVVMVFSQAQWDAILSDSIAKYGTLQDALTEKELVYGSSENNGSAIYGDNIRGEYAGNIWVNLIQEKEQAQQGGITFDAFYYTNNDGDETWMTFKEVVDAGMGVTPTIKNISGTTEAANVVSGLGVNIDNVWKITCPNAMLRENGCVAIQANGAGANDSLGPVDTPAGVTFGQVTKDGQSLVTIVAPSYTGQLGLIVMNQKEEFLAYVIIEVTAQ